MGGAGERTLKTNQVALGTVPPQWQFSILGKWGRGREGSRRERWGRDIRKGGLKGFAVAEYTCPGDATHMIAFPV